MMKQWLKGERKIKILLIFRMWNILEMFHFPKCFNISNYNLLTLKTTIKIPQVIIFFLYILEKEWISSSHSAEGDVESEIESRSIVSSASEREKNSQNERKFYCKIFCNPVSIEKRWKALSFSLPSRMWR